MGRRVCGVGARRRHGRRTPRRDLRRTGQRPFYRGTGKYFKFNRSPTPSVTTDDRPEIGSVGRARQSASEPMNVGTTTHTARPGLTWARGTAERRGDVVSSVSPQGKRPGNVRATVHRIMVWVTCKFSLYASVSHACVCPPAGAPCSSSLARLRPILRCSP